jgi:hypothetical protein
MSMFTRNRTADDPAETGTRLPAGYDDPDSDYWVHPDLRGLYGTDPDTEAERVANRTGFEVFTANRHKSAHVARFTDPEPTGPDSHRELLDWQQRRHDWSRLFHWTPSMVTAEDRRLWAHRVKLELAAERVTADRRAAKAEAERKARGTCWCCETFTPDRMPYGATRLAGHELRVCADCLPVLEQRLTDRAATDQLAGGITRVEAADRYLDTLEAEHGPLKP